MAVIAKVTWISIFNFIFFTSIKFIKEIFFFHTLDYDMLGLTMWNFQIDQDTFSKFNSLIVVQSVIIIKIKYSNFIIQKIKIKIKKNQIKYIINF